jgi:hypothetical protein
MGTGVGEAMLIGAAVGGGTSAITGGDPLKGAMLGAAGGGLGAGFGAAAGATSGTAAGSTSSLIPGAMAGAEGAALGAAAPAAGGTAVGSLSPTVTSLAPASTFGGFNPALASGAAPGATIGSTTGGAAALNPAIVSGAPAAGGASSLGIAAPTSGALGGTSGIGVTNIAGYTPGMYSSGAAPMPGGVTPANTPFSIRDLLSKAPTPDVTGNSETQKQVAQATGKNIFGYMPGEKGFISDPMLAAIGGGSAFLSKKDSSGLPAGEEDYISSFDPSKFRRSEPTYAPEGIYVPQYRDYTTAAEGGIMKAYQSGGPVERMSQMNTAMNPQGGLYPMGMIDKTQYATPTQRPVSAELVTDAPAYERSNPMLMAEGGIAEILENAKAQGLTPEAYQQIYGRGNAIVAMQKALKEGQMVGMADGGISSLGGYSDGGRMLKGPGDGMSDSIPGVIAGKQPARLADGEFVVPADVVSHLGNGSTDAGAKQLYAMMDKVRKARTGKKKQAPAVKVNRYMPA